MANIITAELIGVLRRNFWQVSGNNIDRLPGVEILSAGPGAWQPAQFNQSIRWTGERFEVLTRTVVERPGTPFVDARHTLEFATNSEAALVAWLQANGKQSEGGINGPNVWD